MERLSNDEFWARQTPALQAHAAHQPPLTSSLSSLLDSPSLRRMCALPIHRLDPSMDIEEINFSGEQIIEEEEQEEVQSICSVPDRVQYRMAAIMKELRIRVALV